MEAKYFLKMIISANIILLSINMSIKQLFKITVYQILFFFSPKTYFHEVKNLENLY